MSEDMEERATSEAFDLGDAAFNEMLRIKIQEASDDTRPSISMEEAFERLHKLSEAHRRGT